MKRVQLILLIGLVLACLLAVACKTKADGDDDTKVPNFTAEACAGCPTQQLITQGGAVIAIRFFSYVRNGGEAGKIRMSIDAGVGSASREFDVAAQTSYAFQASVPVEASGSASFIYQAAFPGTPGYTDSHPVSGYRCTGAPYDLQLNAR